ncbi:MAG: DUF6010 family protein [Myxococcota bacterium]
MGFASFVAVLVAAGFVAGCSLLAEPTRQQFTAVVTLCALWGLRSYRWIGVAWLLHVGWDLVHHVVHEPIVAVDPLSSWGCAICDSVLAAWFFAGAPSVLKPRG